MQHPESRAQRLTRQAQAREADTQARKHKLERKKRTRHLIQLGGVLDAWGVKNTEQVESLMRAATASEGWRRWLQEQGVQQTGRWPGT